MKDSKLTFGDLARNLPFIKVFWNGQLIYDDTNEKFIDFDLFQLDYYNKIVYSMNIEVVQFHHCILKVKGE